MRKIDAAMDKFSFLNVPPPNLFRLLASNKTNCAGANPKTAPRPNNLLMNSALAYGSLIALKGEVGENANAPPTIKVVKKLSL
ncbi:unnamed protein product [Bathycoccus prasinos]